MKKLLLLLLSVMVFSCGKETAAKKPAHLLTEGQMENILYDVSIMQAIRSFQPQVLDSNGVDVEHYIYKKYKIDSLTYVQNNTWYASDPEQFEKLLDKVAERIKKEKTKADKLKDKGAAKTKKPKLSNPAMKAKQDSLRKVVLNRNRHQ
jgi:hypothetical protein